jgi:hypothetical protein
MKTLIFLFAVLLSGSDPIEKNIFPDQSGWELSTDFPVYTPENLWDYINGAADSYLSFEFQDMVMAEYSRGKNTIKVEVYHHKDNNNAFGIYASERSSDFDFLDIGAQGYRRGSILNFLAGDYYIKINASSDKEKVVKTMLRIAESLAKNISPDAKFPPILELFPQDGKIAHRESFIARNYLGHEFFCNVFTASYEIGEENFTAFISKKSDPDECKMLLENYYNFTGQKMSIIPEGKHLIKDKYNGNIHLVWAGNVLYGVIDCSDQDIVNRYLTLIGKNIKE